MARTWHCFPANDYIGDYLTTRRKMDNNSRLTLASEFKPTIKINLLALLFYFCLACALTFPAIFRLSGHVMGLNDHPSIRQEYYLQWLFLTGLTSDHPTEMFHTDLANYPYGQDIGRVIGPSLNLFLYAPLAPFLDFFGRTNLLFIIILTLNGFFMFHLMRKIVDDDWIAFACGFFFLFNPYVFMKLNQGFVQKVILFWLPLCWGALWDIVKQNHWASGGLRAGLYFTLMLLTYPQYAVYGSFLILFFVVHAMMSPKNRPGLLKGSLLAGLPVAGGVALFLHIFGGQASPAESMDLSNLQLSDTVGWMSLTNVFRFFPYRYFDVPIPYPLGITITLPVLAVLGRVARRSGARLYFFGAMFFLIMSLGRVLVIGDHFITIGGAYLALPYQWLASLSLPGQLGFPIRSLPFFFFCLILLAGFGLLHLAVLFNKRTHIIVLVVCCLYTAENLIVLHELFPTRVSKADIPEFVEVIRAEPGEALLNVPFSVNYNNYY